MGKIQRANLDGSNVEDLVTGLGKLFALDLDLTAGKMYWTDFGTTKIQRANLDGSGVEDILTATDGLILPSGIALDIASGRIYWADNGDQKIKRANLDGSNIEELVTSGLNDPRHLVLDIPLLNAPPTANAGPDQSIRAGDTVFLDGGTSSSDNTASENLQYAWTLTKPAGSTTTLFGADTAMPSFVADVMGSYTVALVVTDEGGLSSTPDEVVVSSENLAPTAVADIMKCAGGRPLPRG